MSLPDTITVNVTQENLNNGSRGNSAYCPVAQALRDKYEGYNISVSLFSIYLNGNRYTLDDAGSYLIVLYDLGVNVKPRTVTMEKSPF